VAAELLGLSSKNTSIDYAYAQLVGKFEKAPTIRHGSTRNGYVPCFVVFNVFRDFYVIFSDFYLCFRHLREDELWDHSTY